MRILAFFLITFLVLACQNSIEEVDKLLDKEVIQDEKGENVMIIYSDSAELKVKAWAPTMLIDRFGKETVEEFPDGIKVEFYNQEESPESWLEAKYGRREYHNNIVIVRDSVNLYNELNDKLETSELIWDEKAKRIYTEKFVRITQPIKGDTTYGYGFEANQEFTDFKIRNFSGKMTVDEINQALDGEQSNSSPSSTRQSDLNKRLR